MIAPGNDRKRPLRRRFAEQRLCRVLDGVVAPRADGDPRWLGGLGQGKGQFQHAMVAVGGDVSRRRRWSGYSTIEDESWTAKVPCCRSFSALAVLRRNLASGSASVSVFSRHVPDPSVIVALERYRSRRLLLARAATTCRRRAWDGQCVASTARKSCPPAPPIAAMCWAACRRARSRLRGQSVSPPRDRGLPGVGPRNTELDRYTSEGIFRECVGPFTRSTPRGGRHSKSFWMDCPMTPSRKPRPWSRCWRSTEQASAADLQASRRWTLRGPRADDRSSAVLRVRARASDRRARRIRQEAHEHPRQNHGPNPKTPGKHRKGAAQRGRQEQLASRIMQRSPTNADSPEEPVARANDHQRTCRAKPAGAPEPGAGCAHRNETSSSRVRPDARDEAG